MKKEIKTMASSIAEHAETLKSLRDLPSKFDQLMEALSGPANFSSNNNDNNEDADNEEQSEDIVSSLLSKSANRM